MSTRKNGMKEVKAVGKARSVRKVIRRSPSAISELSSAGQNEKPSFLSENSTYRSLADRLREQFSKGTRFLGVAFNIVNEKSQNKGP